MYKYFLRLLASVLLLLGFSINANAEFKVGFVYVGPTGDHGWTYMHDQGLQMIEDELGDKVTTVYVESVPESKPVLRVKPVEFT